jgi:ferredoxin/flavodoxin
MRALVIFYSVTGTVRRVAQRIAEGLEAVGIEVVEHDLRRGPVPDTADFDIIGIGFPVHYFRPAAPAIEALASLGRLDGRSAFVFVVHGTYRGFALNQARAALRRTGAAEIGVFTCYGDDRFLGYTRRGYEFSPDHPTSRELAAAFEFGRGLAAAHDAPRPGRQPAPEPPDPRPGIVYAIEWSAFSPQLIRTIYSRAFRADRTRCTSCGRCARVCPSGNITWEKGERPAWGRNCVGCFACTEGCPEAAVHSALDWALFRPFLAYNVGHAAHDPAIDHVRVEVRRGRIVRLPEEGAARKGEHHEG